MELINEVVIYILMVIYLILGLFWNFNVDNFKDKTRKRILIIEGIMAVFIVIIIIIIKPVFVVALFIGSFFIALIEDAKFRFDYKKKYKELYKYHSIQFFVCLFNNLVGLYIIFKLLTNRWGTRWIQKKK